MKRKIHLVYALIDPITNIVRYIGKSSCGMSRPRNTSGERKGNTRKARWLTKLYRLGKVPEIAIIQRYGSEEDALNGERVWIRRFRETGVDLTNLTDGGDGVCGLQHTESTKQLLRERRAEQPGHRFTPSQRKHMSDAAKGKKKSIEHREALSESVKKAWKDGKLKSTAEFIRQPEVRQRISTSIQKLYLQGKESPFVDPIIHTKCMATRKIRGPWHSEITKKKIAETLTGRKQSEETKEKKSLALKGRKLSMERRLQMIEVWKHRKYRRVV